MRVFNSNYSLRLDWTRMYVSNTEYSTHIILMYSNNTSNASNTNNANKTSKYLLLLTWVMRVMQVIKLMRVNTWYYSHEQASKTPNTCITRITHVCE